MPARRPGCRPTNSRCYSSSHRAFARVNWKDTRHCLRPDAEERRCSVSDHVSDRDGNGTIPVRNRRRKCRPIHPRHWQQLLCRVVGRRVPAGQRFTMRSQCGIDKFALTWRIRGHWDRKDTENAVFLLFAMQWSRARVIKFLTGEVETRSSRSQIPRSPDNFCLTSLGGNDPI